MKLLLLSLVFSLQGLASTKTIDYYKADWCGACKLTKPYIKKFMKKNPNVKVTTLDVDKNKKLAKENDIKYVPAFIFKVDGDYVATTFGSVSDSMLKCLADRFLEKRHKSNCGLDNMRIRTTDDQ